MIGASEPVDSFSGNYDYGVNDTAGYLATVGTVIDSDAIEVTYYLVGTGTAQATSFPSYIYKVHS